MLYGMGDLPTAGTFIASDVDQGFDLCLSLHSFARFRVEFINFVIKFLCLLCELLCELL